MSHMSHCQIAWTCPNNRANWAKYTSRKAKIGITGKAPKIHYLQEIYNEGFWKWGPLLLSSPQKS